MTTKYDDHSQKPCLWTLNDVFGLFTKTFLLDEEFSILKSTTAALHDDFQGYHALGKDAHPIDTDEVQNEEESDAFFDDITEVANSERGKINKHHFYIEKFEEKYPKFIPISQTLILKHISTLRSKLSDLKLPTFDGQTTIMFQTSVFAKWHCREIDV